VKRCRKKTVVTYLKVLPQNSLGGAKDLIQRNGLLGFEAATAVVMKTSIFWSITLCTLFATCIALVSCFAHSSAVKMEAICSSETSVDFQRTTQRYIQSNRFPVRDQTRVSIEYKSETSLPMLTCSPRRVMITSVFSCGFIFDLDFCWTR
jgi:hypothetical protein